ncbi:MAG TPA: beta-ketoacyl-[acyl-carrier-protein] synthase family protein [Phycisphaerales bacterium]|nr:beta-ketoacyl-[acyl-carrier-protein] synthase family protein [Phycisphaerales bacterium]
MSSHPRIVITGMGWITPLGFDLATVWQKLTSGASGVSRIDRFAASTFPTTFAAQIRNYDFRPFVTDPAIHADAGLNVQFALGAARQAWNQSGLNKSASINPRRIGLYLGAGEGVLDFDNYARANIAGWDESANRVNAVNWAREALACMTPVREIEQESNMPLAHLAREFNIRGPACNCLTACAASTQAVGEAMDILRRGEADVMLTGGTHTMLHPLGVTGFNRLTALSQINDDMLHASRPFDRTRAGFVMGEGSGMVILETLDHARARNAQPLAEMIGFGSTADAFRITDMHPEGRGPASAIAAALADARIDPLALGPDGRPLIHYISAHGTGTKENDSVETLAVKTIFKDNAPRIPMSSIKSMMGHLIAAAGAVELITCALAIQHNMLPPTTNLREPDPDLDLDYVPNAARACKVDTCLSNSFGFGGQNDTIIVRRFTN